MDFFQEPSRGNRCKHHDTLSLRRVSFRDASVKAPYVRSPKTTKPREHTVSRLREPTCSFPDCSRYPCSAAVQLPRTILVSSPALPLARYTQSLPIKGRWALPSLAYFILYHGLFFFLAFFSFFCKFLLSPVSLFVQISDSPWNSLDIRFPFMKASLRNLKTISTTHLKLLKNTPLFSSVIVRSRSMLPGVVAFGNLPACCVGVDLGIVKRP